MKGTISTNVSLSLNRLRTKWELRFEPEEGPSEAIGEIYMDMTGESSHAFEISHYAPIPNIGYFHSFAEARRVLMNVHFIGREQP